jgi:hypothetical protein
MTGTRKYTVVGWLVWKVGGLVAKRKVRQNRVKLGAASVVALALAGGVAAARSSQS